MAKVVCPCGKYLSDAEKAAYGTRCEECFADAVRYVPPKGEIRIPRHTSVKDRRAAGATRQTRSKR